MLKKHVPAALVQSPADPSPGRNDDAKPASHASDNNLAERGSRHQKYFSDMSFVDVEAEEEGASIQAERQDSSSDADTSLSGFICEDDSVDSPSVQVNPQSKNKKTKSATEAHLYDDSHAQALRAASETVKAGILFDPAESAASASPSSSSSSASSPRPIEDECDAPRSFLSSHADHNQGIERRQIEFDDKTLELPGFVNSISVVLPDGVCADMEVEPYEIWRKSSARPMGHPSLRDNAATKVPSDWFDELQFCKDRRGGFGVRSARKVIAGTAKIRFPSGRRIEVPVKRIVVEHTFFPYDAATWEQPANYIVPQRIPVESSDEDIIDPSDATSHTPPLADEVLPPKEARADSRARIRDQCRTETTVIRPNGPITSARRKQKPSIVRIERASADVNMSEVGKEESEKESGSVGYVLSESDASLHEMVAPARARMSTRPHLRLNINGNRSERQDVLQRPVARIKAHTTSLQTTKQKLRRQRRLELMRLKRDLLEENSSLTQLWPLSERRTKRQVRNEQARKTTTAQTRAEARGAAYNFLLPG